MPTPVSEIELGTTGLKQFAGVVNEEWNSKLTGKRATELFIEMRDNDPVVGAILFVVEYLLVKQPWHLDPAKGTKGRKAKDLVEKAMAGMDHTWADFVAEALSMVQFGWAYHEIVYKVNPDNTIGWRKLPIRGQETLDEWKFGEHGEILGMVQHDYYAANPKAVYIPISKAIHLRTTVYKNNPEGRSVLRSAARTYLYLKRMQEVEAIGVERDLAGLPILHVPEKYLDTNAPAHIKTQLAAFKKLMQQLRNDERASLIFPPETDASGKPTGFKFYLAASAGRRAIDTNAIITRYEQRIAMTMLAQFIMLGQGASSSGSFALADKQASIFTSALQSFLNRIADEMNRFAIPELCWLNGIDREFAPTLRAESLQDVSLATIATYINQLVAAKVLEPDNELEAHLRKVADLPIKGTPRVEEKEKADDDDDDAKMNPFNGGRPSNDDTESRDTPTSAKQDPSDAEDKVNVRTQPEKK